MWDGGEAQVAIFAANAGVTYPILMRGGINGIMQDYDCLYDIAFVIDRDGIIRYRGAFEDAAVGALVADLVDGAASPAPELPRRDADLLPPYPNPFNPRTVIPYTVGGGAGPAPVELAVLDLRGRVVKVLVAGQRERGLTHEAAWDGADAGGRPQPSGAYLVRLRTDGAERTRRITLLK